MAAPNDFARLAAAGFKGRAERLTEQHLLEVGRMAGLSGTRELRAVIAVESSGSGFYADGRPKALFEPHKFFRHLSGAKREKAVAAGLAYAKWGTKPYPKDSYPRIIQALALDETAALKATSWGLTQILGENHAACGFATPQEMVAAFCDRESAHMTATIALMRSMGILDDLQARNWPGVARGWNGPQYAKHKYDLKLANAYKASAKAVKAAAVSGTVLSPIPAVRPTAAKQTPKPLPASAPMSLGELIAGFFASLTHRPA